MGKTVAETIRKITKKHIDSGKGFVIGQCLTAVGWVQNTIPKQKRNYRVTNDRYGRYGYCSWCFNCGIKTNNRFKIPKFLWLNSSPLVMHAAKAKEIFGYGAPVFVRAIASEANYGHGPLPGNNYHSPFIHMPGLKVCAPMTSKEYLKIWNEYKRDNSPYLVSEHRSSYKSDKELKNIYNKDAKITIFAISSARYNALKTIKFLYKKNIKFNLIHLVWLSPLKISKKDIVALNRSKKGIVIDASYTDCGITSTIAYKLMQKTNAKVIALGLENRSSGASIKTENGTPSSIKILKTIKKFLKN